MYGGSGRRPMRSTESQSRLQPSRTTRTLRRPSSRVSPICNSASSAPFSGETTFTIAPGLSRAPGRTMASNDPSPKARSSRVSPAPPPLRRRISRAWRTFTSLGTSSEFAGMRFGKFRIVLCESVFVRASTTNSRAPSRSAVGCWAINSSGRSKWNSERFISGIAFRAALRIPRRGSEVPRGCRFQRCGHA